MSQSGGGETARRASAGELVFDADIDEVTRARVAEMWVNRLAGFHRLELSQYLRDNTDETRHLIDGRVYSFKTYRRVCRVLFALQRVGAPLGTKLTAEVLDAHITQCSKSLLTDSHAVLMLGPRIVRQSRLTISAVDRSGRWIWDEIVDRRIPRCGWPYRLQSDGDNGTRFLRAEALDGDDSRKGDGS